MKEDLKIFLRFIFDIRGYLEYTLRNLRKPRTIAFILGAFSIYFLLKLQKPKGYIIAALCLLISMFILIIVSYKSGEHRDWYRKKMKLRGKKELLKHSQLNNWEENGKEKNRRENRGSNNRTGNVSKWDGDISREYKEDGREVRQDSETTFLYREETARDV